MNITMKDVVPVEFKVSASEEDRKAGRTQLVKFRVNFTKTSGETFQNLAIGAQNIRWQAQLKGQIGEGRNLADVIKELPAEVYFGEPLFGTGRRTAVREMSVDEAISKVHTLPRIDQLKALVKMYDSMDQEPPQTVLDELNELLMEEVENNLKG